MTTHDPVRRAMLATLAGAAISGSLPGWAKARTRGETLVGRIEALERACGGRLGVSMLDTASGDHVGWRADERFGLCSTFKFPLAAAILREGDAGRLSLDRILPYGKEDMVPHAPVTRQHLAEGGMTIAALAEAAQTTSDNVAANLLVRHLGGPARVTALFRDMGDAQTRIDRYEPGMNLVPAGEVRDTTTPRAMAATAVRVMTGELLSSDSRARLRAWMIATETGKRRIRAGLPADWVAGDKTGTGATPGMPNKHNDVAVIWPPKRPPVVVAAYLEASGHFEPMRPEDDAVLADVGRLVAAWVAKQS